MRGVLVEVPPGLLAERARLGIDKSDEMWQGEIHMVPPASAEHQRIAGELFVALRSAARDSTVLVRYETGLFDPGAPQDTDYRVPDLVVFDPAHLSDRGVEGAAALVMEIRSPGDESLEKIGFYERVGVGEVLVIDRDTKDLRQWQRRGDALVEMQIDEDMLVSPSLLPVTLRTIAGRLEVVTPAGTTVI